MSTVILPGQHDAASRAGQVTELTEGGLVHVGRGTPHTFATPPGDGAHFLTGPPLLPTGELLRVPA